jgi:hypothetical protein
MAGRHVLDDHVRVPGTADDAIAMIPEPADELIGILAVGSQVGFLEPLNDFKCQPGMADFFMDSPLLPIYPSSGPFSIPATHRVARCNKF